MAVPKKGLRKIVVGGEVYYWKFQGTILVVPEKKRNQTLLVDFGWYDVWLYINDPPDQRPPDFEPQVVTPKFVEQAISVALLNGWPENRLQLKYQAGNYEVQA